MEKEELAVSILHWWKDAQYEEDYPGHNRYFEEPDFVVGAKKIVGKMAATRILEPYLPDEMIKVLHG